MTLDFQDNVLKFILNTKEGRSYIGFLDSALFDLPERQIAFDLISKYFLKYQTVPSKANLLEYFSIESKKTKGMTEEAYKQLDGSIRELYVENFVTDTGIIREEIIKFAQRKMTKLMFRENADKVSEGDDKLFENLYKEMGKIVDLAKSLDDDKNRGGFVLKDYRGMPRNIYEGKPTFLRKLNSMTAAGGFNAPELIILMSGPKAFKTGTAINIATEYMRDGLNVYYVDCENGLNKIKGRVYQTMMGLSKKELYQEENQKILKEMVNRFQHFGGDMIVDYYPAYSKTVDDVNANLEYYRDEYGWMPDLIIWDYPDLLNPRDRKIAEKRLKIQAAYHDIIWLHNKWEVFGIGLSQVGKNAVNKEVITMKDFAEDFGKAHNAHGAFAICRTEEELASGMARIVPVMQREGVQYRGEQDTCYIEIDEEHHKITEIEDDNLVDIVKRPSQSKTKSRPATSNITDD